MKAIFNIDGYEIEAPDEATALERAHWLRSMLIPSNLPWRIRCEEKSNQEDKSA
jgi:hypothetical protein